jgi:hypothetical protein
MVTSTSNVNLQVQAEDVRFEGDFLHIVLSDGREISLRLTQLTWLKWLAKATPEQRAEWTIEPGGFAIYWDKLDDGIEIEHLLSLQPLI